jgi:hypothetical protein
VPGCPAVRLPGCPIGLDAIARRTATLERLGPTRAPEEDLRLPARAISSPSSASSASSDRQSLPDAASPTSADDARTGQTTGDRISTRARRKHSSPYAVFIAEALATAGGSVISTALRFGLFLPPFAELAEPRHLVVGVGLGDDGWSEFSSFSGEERDLTARAQIVDESLDLLRKFWSGDEVHMTATRLSVDSAPFLPRPLQDPLPVWVACRWPHRRPLVRAARHQGCFPLFDPGGRAVPGIPDPAAVASTRSALLALNAAPDIDIVCRGFLDNVPMDRRQTIFAELEAAGMTWWLESFGAGDPPARSVERTVLAGPPQP